MAPEETSLKKIYHPPHKLSLEFFENSKLLYLIQMAPWETEIKSYC